MRHVSKIVAEGIDATTPSSLVTALRTESGLKNTATELIRLDLENVNIRTWDNLRGQKKNGLPWIGRNNEYQYPGWCGHGKRLAFDAFVTLQLELVKIVNSVDVGHVSSLRVLRGLCLRTNFSPWKMETRVSLNLQTAQKRLEMKLES
ncbi:hypothetical protein BWQ96_04849 [Gracilariopsis chorda]|uniref:Uncharacterized protein n=1 Tax=Gracilariopsis chorda TaxID=448386 RepID=A0A2V3ITJ6_9FLOR|nr:hypothetical protein BWQ96_04849 [Gracilariopsis chorda]|eukprot:PXF45434.1 hypothetical protein BWQ96_04849 [Gracilariopsis chorda]